MMPPRQTKPILLGVTLLLAVSFGFAADASSAWQSLAPGLELKYFKASKPSIVGDSRIAVLRMDPNLWELEVAGISQTGESTGHTAHEWCDKRKFVAAINAGMFAGTAGGWDWAGGRPASGRWTRGTTLLHAGGTEIEMFGSYETSFKPNDDNAAPWPVPNVLGARLRAGH
jgi:hypothetical protein